MSFFYNRYRAGGSGSYRSRETSNQNPSTFLRIYAAVTVDFELGQPYLWLVTAESARAAKFLLHSVPRKGQEFGGIVELTAELVRHLDEIVRDGDWSGIFCVSFKESGADGCEVVATEVIATNSKPLPPNQVRLFVCLTSTSFYQSKLMFVRAVDGEDAAAQLRAVGRCERDSIIVAVGPKLLTALSRFAEVHEADQVSFLYVGSMCSSSEEAERE